MSLGDKHWRIYKNVYSRVWGILREDAWLMLHPRRFIFPIQRTKDTLDIHFWNFQHETNSDSE